MKKRRRTVLIIGSKEPGLMGIHFGECLIPSFLKLYWRPIFVDPSEMKEYLTNWEDYINKKPIKISDIIMYKKIEPKIDFIFIDQTNSAIECDTEHFVIYYHKYLFRVPHVFYPNVIIYSDEDMYNHHSKQAVPWYFHGIKTHGFMPFALAEGEYTPKEKTIKGIIGIGYRRDHESWREAGGMMEWATNTLFQRDIEEFRELEYPYVETPVSDESYREILSKSDMLWFPIPHGQYITRRMFEAMACKTLCVFKVESKRHEEVLRSLGFESGVHYIGVDSIKDIPYIEETFTDEMISEIIENAYEVVMKEHTHMSRVKYLLSFIKHSILTEATILDLGCGLAKTEGSFGVDCADLEGVDLVYDLNTTPYPFYTNQFTTIILNDILEHLDDPIDVLRECYRILKPNGSVKIRVLYWNHKYNYSDPQHKHAFTEVYFEFFCGKRRPYYMDYAFSDLKIEYKFTPEAIREFGGDKEVLLQKAYFYNNIISTMYVELIK